MQAALPPGPRAPAALQTLEWVLRPVGLMERCQAEYGDLFTLRLGPARVVMMSDPAHVKQVFTGNATTLRMGDINGLFRAILGSNGLLLAAGGEPIRQRKLMLPPFHGQRMRSYGRTMEEIAEREVSDWPTGEPFQLLPRMQSITVDVILQTVFGQCDARLRELTVELLHRCQSYSTMLPQLRRKLAGHAPWAKLMRCLARVDALLYAEIAHRRSAGIRGDDVLSMLLDAHDEHGRGMTDEELRDELLTLLVAGHETTASALAFCFERLLRHPDVLEKLIDEMSWGGDEYMDAVIKETLRLRPVLPIVARKTTEPFELGDHLIPRGSVLMPSVYLVHRHPAYWDDAE